MNYYLLNKATSSGDKAYVNRILSSKEWATIYGYETTNDFTRSKFCEDNFTQWKLEKAEADEDGYSKYGRHVPKQYTNVLHETLTVLLQPIIKRFKTTGVCLVMNRRGKPPTTIKIK